MILSLKLMWQSYSLCLETALEIYVGGLWWLGSSCCMQSWWWWGQLWTRLFQKNLSYIFLLLFAFLVCDGITVLVHGW